jgi:hypothetical protein
MIAHDSPGINAAVAKLLRETAVPIVGNTQSCSGILPTLYPNNVAGMRRIDVFADYQRALVTKDPTNFVHRFEF